MKVLATARGYYDRRIREAGEAFSLSDPAHFSRNWMKSVEPETPAPLPAAAPAHIDQPAKRPPGRPRKES